ncbi:hypothetical protein L7F22_021952 [Adiantum nelumboides]|nr:hypothetical protein [Adiantum nelumboides]
MAPLLPLCVLAFMHAVLHAAALLSLPSGAHFSPALSWGTSPSASTHVVNSYPLLPYGPFSIFAPILSSSSFTSSTKGFSFGFLSVFDLSSAGDITPARIFLAVCLGSARKDGNGQGFAVPVWVANQNFPLTVIEEGRAGLTVNSQRELLLTDGDGSVMWAVRGPVSSIELYENGNLVVYNSENDTLWKSFDDPGDVLVQGQALPMGKELVSSNSMYVAQMRAGGFYFYLQSSSSVPLAYFLIALNNTVEDAFSGWLSQGSLPLSRELSVNFTAALESPVVPSASLCKPDAHKHGPFAVLQGENFTLLYGNGCPSYLNVSWPVLAYFQNHILDTLHNSDLVRLDRDGIMRGYTYLNHQGQHFFSSDKANFSLCFAPNACGPHGLCSPYAAGQEHRCKCPSVEDNPAFYGMFAPINTHDLSLGCRRTVPLQCKAGVNQSLVKMEGATFISFRAIFEVTARYNIFSLKDCLQRCASNCSCSGIYYHKSSSFCLPFSDKSAIANVSLLSIYTEEYATYLKVQFTSIGSAVVDGHGANGVGSSSRKRILPASIAAASLLLLGLMVTLLLFYKRKRQQRNAEFFIDEKDPDLADIVPMLPTRFSYRELRRATNGFSKLLGKGGFGSVFEGMLPDSRRVAVKRLEMIVPQLKPFLTEVATIGSISHFNIVRLHGFCSERSQRLLVYEHMENGSLEQWLFNKDNSSGLDAESSQQEVSKTVNVGFGENKDKNNSWYSSSPGNKGKLSDGGSKEAKKAMLHVKDSFGGDKKEHSKVFPVLSWELRYNIALGTARALAYLHEDSPRPIIHFDIKPENILLDADFVPKLSDFGLAKLVERGASNVYTLVRGTAGYMAPEWLSHSLVSKKCDVYSYGMVLLEVIGGRRNADPLYALTDQWYFPKWAAMLCRKGKEGELVDKRLQGCYDGEQLRRLVQVAFLCIHKEPGLRPSMSTVCKLLEGGLSLPSLHKGDMDTSQGDLPPLDHLLHETLSQFDSLQGTNSEVTNTNKSSPVSLYSTIEGR